MRARRAVQIHPPGRIDVHERAAQYQQALISLETKTDVLEEDKNLIRAFLRDCALGKTIKRGSKKRIGPGRCLKYLGLLTLLSRAFGKGFNSVTQADMERFIEELESNRIVARSGKDFSEATKTDIKKAIRKFWKWKDGGSRTYPELVEWIDTSESVKDVPALTRDEVERMIDQAGNDRDKALVMVLFDSGARAEELLNVRLKKEHLFWKEDVGCYMIRLEYSKTKPRTISIPLSSTVLRRWLERHAAGNGPQVQLFPMGYDALRMTVSRLARRALGKRVTPHVLRHSSATYYANRLKNPYKLCYRYGWTMSSKMVDRYLDREGILEEETSAVVRADEVGRHENESRALKEELTMVREAQAELLTSHEKLKAELEVLRAGKGMAAILAGLPDQQRRMAEALKGLTGRPFDVVLMDLEVTGSGGSDSEISRNRGSLRKG